MSYIFLFLQILSDMLQLVQEQCPSFFLPFCYRTPWLAANAIKASCGPSALAEAGNGSWEEGTLPTWSIFFSSLLENVLESKMYPQCQCQHTLQKTLQARSSLKEKVNKCFSKDISPPPTPPLVWLLLSGMKQWYKISLFSSFMPKQIASGNQIARSISLGQIL